MLILYCNEKTMESFINDIKVFFYHNLNANVFYFKFVYSFFGTKKILLSAWGTDWFHIDFWIFHLRAHHTCISIVRAVHNTCPPPFTFRQKGTSCYPLDSTLCRSPWQKRALRIDDARSPSWRRAHASHHLIYPLLREAKLRCQWLSFFFTHKYHTE